MRDGRKNAPHNRERLYVTKYPGELTREGATEEDGNEEAGTRGLARLITGRRNPVFPGRLGSFRIREMRYHWLSQYRLVKDAADLLDARYDFHRFDALMLVVGADPKELGRCGYLFRSSTGFHRPRTPGGQTIPPTDVHTWNCPFPSIAYALPKMVAGYRDGRAVVPTLYDFDAQSSPGPFGYANQWVGGMGTMQYYSRYVGPWDIQSQHGIRTGAEILPQGMTSFTRIRSGWIDELKIATLGAGEARRLRLPPLVNGEGKTLAVRLQEEGVRVEMA